MVVFFLTTQKTVCEYIAERLERNFCHCVKVFTNPRHCYKELMSMGISNVDLIACDYMMFDMEEINPFKIMSVHKCVLPFFFYNTPFASRSDRVNFWLAKIQKRMAVSDPDAGLSDGTLSDIENVLRQVDSILSAPDISPYVRLLSTTPDFPECELSSFRKRNHIQSSRFKVLAYLFTHRNQKISEEDLCLHVWNEFSPKRIRVLYSYISELRKICRQDIQLHMTISRPSKQCYCLTVSP
ncbi:MAG: helix-turn-helix domain-containing protein [Treponema sp.]|nr:helix-turn-helix domain-containing protein [Treponema sp.]